MRKRFLSALLAFCMVLTLLPATALAAENDEAVARGWFGDQLEDDALLVYDALVSTENFTKLQRGEEVEVTGFTGNLNATQNAVTDAIAAFGRDHCEIFWTSGVGMSVGTSNGVVTLVRVTLPLAKPWSEGTRTALTDYTTVNDAVTARANAVSGTDAEKVTAIHNWLIDNNQYGNPSLQGTSQIPWTPLSALVNDSNDTAFNPVCEGYARAFKLICDELKIPCILVSGKGTNSSGQAEDHMWNYVQIDGNWYAVDVTWDDPVTGNGTQVLRDSFLLVGSETACEGRPFDETHVSDTHFLHDSDGNWNKNFTYPELSKISYNDYLAEQEKNLTVAEVPTASSITYGDLLSTSTITSGSVVDGNGKEVTGTWTWVDGTQVLPAGSDTVARAKFTATDDSSRTIETNVNVTVLPKTLTEAMVSDIETVVYTGDALTPAVTVTDGAISLVKDTDYTVAYADNTNAGTATVTVSGMGNYTGTVTKNFVIAKADSATVVDLGSKTVRVGSENLTLADLPADADFTNAEVAVTSGDIFTAVPTLNGNVLNFTLKADAAEGDTAVLTITGTSANHVSVPVTVSIEIRNKTAQPALTISGDSSVAVGESLTLSANGGADANTQPVRWTVSDTSIASINAETGVLTGLSAGTVTVTATKDEDDTYAAVSATKEITVTAVNSGLTVSADKTDVTVGETVMLTAASGAAGDTRTVDWSVSDASIAELSASSGNSVSLTALKEGTVTVTAAKTADGTFEAASASVTITVTKADSGLTISADKRDAAVGETVTLTANGGAAGDTRTINWSVSDAGIAELSASSGSSVSLTALKEGTVTVTAAKEATDAFDAVSASVTITVSKIKQTLHITSSDEVTYGNDLSLRADLDGVTWTVTNRTGKAEIVDSNILRPIEAGTVTITATKAGDGIYTGASDSMTVIIRPTLDDVDKILTNSDIDSTASITVSKDTIVNDDGERITSLTVTTNLTTDFEQLTRLFRSMFSHTAYDNGNFYYYSTMDSVNAFDSIASTKGDTRLVWMDADRRHSVYVEVPAVEEDDDETYYISVPSSDNGEVIANTRHAARGERVSLSVYPDNGYELDSLVVTDARGREISLRYTDDRVYVFSMPSSRVTVETVFVKTEDAAPTTPDDSDDPADQLFTGLGTPGISGIVLNPAPMPFNDVRSTDWFYNHVEYMWKHYLMSGTSDTSFAPNVTTSRGMIWTILARMNNVRTDVNPGSTWYERGQLWAMERGITDGSNPMQEVTREQLVTMLWRNAGSPGSGAVDLSQFSDAASVSAYAQSAVRWAVGMGVLNGSNGQLNPKGTATRAQVAAMVARYGDKVA